MKSKTHISIFLLLSIFFISCENNGKLTEITLAGKWNVSHTIGGFSKPKDYAYGTFTWNFDMDKKTITIINSADVFTALDIPSFTNNQGGVYSYKTVEENGINILVVGNRKATIDLDENGLTLDFGIAADDIGYIFKR